MLLYQQILNFFYFLSIEINTKIVWFLEYQCARKFKTKKSYLPTNHEKFGSEYIKRIND